MYIINGFFNGLLPSLVKKTFAFTFHFVESIETGGMLQTPATSVPLGMKSGVPLYSPTDQVLSINGSSTSISPLWFMVAATEQSPVSSIAAISTAFKITWF